MEYFLCIVGTYFALNRTRGKHRMEHYAKKVFLLWGTTLIYISCLFAQAPDTLWTRVYGWQGDDQGNSICQTFDKGYIIVGQTQSSPTRDYDIFLLKTNQYGDTTWAKMYGGTQNDIGYAVEQTLDTGYVIIGSTRSFGAGNSDVYLIKTDAHGDTLWTKTYGGSENDVGHSVKQTSDNGYIVAGYTQSFGASPGDVYIIKTDAHGDTLWTRMYGNIESEQAWEVIELSSGGYIIAGYAQSIVTAEYNAYVISLDVNGDTLWTKTYGGSGHDEAHSIIETPDAGFVIIGSTRPELETNYDIYVIKTLDNGDTLWTKTYGPNIGDDQGWSLQNTSDGGYILAGYSNSFGAGDYDMYLIKTDVNGNVMWDTTYGGTDDEMCSSVQQTSDNRYIIVGSTQSFGAGSNDVYIVKTGFHMDTVWTNTYGGIGDDRGYSVQQTFDNNYIITGKTTSFGSRGDSADVYLINTDSIGNTIWTKTYGGPGDDGGYSVSQTTDGGYIITGYTNSYGAGRSDAYLLKTDADGDTNWTRTYGGIENDGGNSVNQTTDGGYIITGYTYPFGVLSSDVYLIKTNSSGDTAWTKTYGGVDDDEGFSVCQTTDGGYIITGYTYRIDQNDVYLIKTDANGDTVWTKTYGGAKDDGGCSVYQTSDGGYIITGYTNPFDNYDVYLIKTDVNGDTLWTKTYGGTGDEQGRGVRQNLSGGYIICGYTNSFGAGAGDVYLIKTNDSGETIWTQTYGGIEDDRSYALQQVSDGGYIITGYTNSFGAGGADVYLIKTEPDDITNIQELKIPTRISPILRSMPNPFKDQTKITYTLTTRSAVCIDIYNLLGQNIKTLVDDCKNAGIHEVMWDGNDKTGKKVSSGIYFMKLSLNWVEGKKITLFGKLLLIQ
jgi:hypothetical protein